MESNRILSRSIVLDIVSEKMQQERYLKHRQSLQKISHSDSKHLFFDHRQKQHELPYRNQFMKTNKSFIKQIYDNRSQQNEALIKRMVDIDRRKNQYKSSCSVFPFIFKNHKNEEQQLRKSNEILVEKIVHQRSPKSKLKILEQSRAYQKYRENLRKVKNKTPIPDHFPLR